MRGWRTITAGAVLKPVCSNSLTVSGNSLLEICIALAGGSSTRLTTKSAVRLEGFLVVVDLVQHDLGLVFRVNEHIELLAARLFARLARVVQRHLDPALDVFRLDADIHHEYEHQVPSLAGVTSAPTRSTMRR